MKKIVFIFLLIISAAFSGEINEYVSDVYFANGVNTNDASAESTKNEIKTKKEKRESVMPMLRERCLVLNCISITSYNN